MFEHTLEAVFVVEHTRVPALAVGNAVAEVVWVECGVEELLFRRRVAVQRHSMQLLFVVERSVHCPAVKIFDFTLCGYTQCLPLGVTDTSKNAIHIFEKYMYVTYH